MPVVVDASALVEVLLRTQRSAAVLDAVGDTEMVAPDLINVEVLSVLRRLVSRDLITGTRGDQAVADLRFAPLRRFPTLPLLDEAWRLRRNVSMYDACYVALADALGCALVSGDARLGRAPGLPVQIIVP